MHDPFQRLRRVGPAALLLATAAFTAACDAGTPVERLVFQVVRTIPHDSTAYTQGLLLHDGRLFESTGRYGASTVRTVDPATGAVLADVPLDSMYFGEGLARVDDRLIQLTWKEGTARVLDVESLDSVGSFTYGGDGWGLCYDGSGLWMSDGTSRLTRRNAETFAVERTLDVTADGTAVFRLNELECVDGLVWANVYQRDEIVRIDPATGRVTGIVDAQALTRDAGRFGDREAVLNGIAWNPAAGTFYVTGKLWPTMYEIRLDGP